jgi:hypothetical protein
MITSNYYTYSADEDLLKTLVYQYGAVIAAVQVKKVVILHVMFNFRSNIIFIIIKNH